MREKRVQAREDRESRVKSGCSSHAIGKQLEVQVCDLNTNDEHLYYDIKRCYEMITFREIVSTYSDKKRLSDEILNALGIGILTLFLIQFIKAYLGILGFSDFFGCDRGFHCPLHSQIVIYLLMFSPMIYFIGAATKRKEWVFVFFLPVFIMLIYLLGNLYITYFGFVEKW